MAQIFEQLPSETGKAYAAFVSYLSLGPERTFEATAKKIGKCVACVVRWKKKNNWEERAKAHDAHMAGVQLKLEETIIRGKMVEWTKRAQELKELEWEAAKKGIARVIEFLNKPPARMSVRDAAQLLDVASKVGRLATGLATEHKEITGQDGGPIQIELTSALNKVYGEIIDIPSEASDTSGALPASGESGGLPEGTSGELPAGGDNPSTATTASISGGAPL